MSCPAASSNRSSCCRQFSVAVAFGTRPEAIKLAPVIRELLRCDGRFRTTVIVTGQHREMLEPVLKVFDIRPDFDLGVMRRAQTLSGLTGRVLSGVESILRKQRPDLVIVQGDATSAFASALASYYQRIPVAHVEAGLRTYDRYAPFPEEVNRRFVTAIAELHFAPTARAAGNLQREGVPAERTFVTGNTVVDALKVVRQDRASGKLSAPFPAAASGRKLILVTGHRRESFGPAFQEICRAIVQVAARNPDVEIVYPVHLNPAVRKPVFGILKDRERVRLVEPLEYLPFVRLMEAAYLILTDSGGIQEEAPVLHKPVLVMREKTERPEAVECGAAWLVGTTAEEIVSHTERLLRDRAAYSRMARAKNPFGDGRAAQRIVRIVYRFLAGYGVLTSRTTVRSK